MVASGPTIARAGAGTSAAATGSRCVIHPPTSFSVSVRNRTSACDRPPPVSDLRLVQAFVVVAEELHFRRAAERLAITQSPLSRIIRRLEFELDAPLFERTKRAVRLTAAGDALLPVARRLLAQADDFAVAARAGSLPLP